MPLVRCPECNGRVSKTAPACPHCGHQLINKFTDPGANARALLAVLLFILLVMMLVGVLAVR